ncbi:hypothetical protein D3C75_848340 [compost metagenome]
MVEPDAVEEQVQGTVGCIKNIAEHKGNCDAVHDVRQEQHNPEGIFAPQLAVQYDGEIDGGNILKNPHGEIGKVVGEHFKNIRVAEHLTVIVQTNPRLLRAIAIPVGEAVVDQLDRRIIGECRQQNQRNQQKRYNN